MSRLLHLFGYLLLALEKTNLSLVVVKPLPCKQGPLAGTSIEFHEQDLDDSNVVLIMGRVDSDSFKNSRFLTALESVSVVNRSPVVQFVL